MHGDCSEVPMEQLLRGDELALIRSGVRIARYRTPQEFRQEARLCNVESRERFPHPHNLYVGLTFGPRPIWIARHTGMRCHRSHQTTSAEGNCPDLHGVAEAGSGSSKARSWHLRSPRNISATYILDREVQPARESSGERPSACARKNFFRPTRRTCVAGFWFSSLSTICCCCGRRADGSAVPVSTRVQREKNRGPRFGG
jgi:hypothetical protein